MGWFFLPLHADPGDPIAPLTPLGLLTQWSWDWAAAIPILLSTGLYLWGVRILRRRGDAWEYRRTIPWMLGMGQLTYATMGALGAYDTVLFSVHMVQHMILSMTAPVAMAQGAPITLALRTLQGRPRAMLLGAIHSRVAKFLLFPGFTTALMATTPLILYPTGLYELTLTNDVYHDLLHVYMVMMGCAFFFPLVGPDPSPWKLPYPLRMMLFLLTMPFHAFIGTMIMGSKTLIAENWYLAFNRTWGPSPLDDQYLAGAILWATGDFTMLSTMFALFIGWWQESQREARREDRRLDREERLAELAELRAASGSAPDSMQPKPRNEDSQP